MWKCCRGDTGDVHLFRLVPQIVHISRTTTQCRGYRDVVRVRWGLGPLGIPRHATFANVRTFSPTLEPDDGLASAPGRVTPYTGGFLVAGVLCRWPGLLSELRISLGQVTEKKKLEITAVGV